MKITIKEPCHENWNNMAPNDKGAFCLSCKKNVVDFSKKTIDEVKTFFTELPITERVCGRFKEAQLNEMNFDHFLNEFMSWKLVQKAAIICFFVFGAALFSGCSNSNDHVVGEMIVVPDTLKQNPPPLDSIKDTTMLLGEPAMEKDTVCTSEVKETGKIGNNRSKHLMGGSMVLRDTAATHLKGNIKVVPEEKK
ncbi:MAG: hypothetical protein JNJ41_07535 [Bacteroidia bacterium]|nr:hypothetical protein [Bacteroidia bacterium]